MFDALFSRAEATMNRPTGLPAHGRARAEICADLQSFRAHDLKWRSGRVFGYVHDAGADAEAIGKAAYLDYLGENGLDPTVFPSLLQLETAIVSTVAAHVGDPNAVGHFTSGGTESILLAAKAARDLARARGIAQPRMILPATAPAAFHKGAAISATDLGVEFPRRAASFRADRGGGGPSQPSPWR
jgi:glutamate/tyrosine decarboxylase-like PLP-dependent enzyme